MFVMMRRLICFLLVLVFSMSLATPVLAASSIPNTPPVGVTPKTGDQIMTYVIIMIIAVLALVAVVLFSRKAFKK